MAETTEQPGVLNSMADAMAELDRRAAARGEPIESEEDDSSESQDESDEVATADEEKTTEVEASEPELEEIEHDGKKYKLPPELKGALLRQQDYTQKTQAVAEEKRTVEAAKQQTIAIATQLQQTQQVLAQMAQNMVGTEPDIALAHQDPATFLVLQNQYRQRMEQFQQLQQHGQALQQQQAQVNERTQSEYRQREAQSLLKAIPDLAKPEKFSEFKTQAVDVGSKYGIAPEEISAITDHRLILALRDLAKFHKLQAQNGELKTKLANTPPKVQKPGSAATQTPAAARNADALRAFKKSGGTDRALREYLAKTS